MSWIVAKMKWIMLASGILTCTMIHAAIAPRGALRSMFGDTLEGPLAEIIVRSRGVLIALIGAMLIYGALNPVSRPLILTVAGSSKLAFIGLILAYGTQFLGHQVGVAILVDFVMAALFIGYLAGIRRSEVKS